jgi:flagellar biogenesis protein FliO
MADPNYLRTLAALFFVLGLLALAVWLVRRLDLGARLGRAAGARIGVQETRWLDHRTKLLLVRWDAAEHLVLVTPQGAVRLESRSAPGDLPKDPRP